MELPDLGELCLDLSQLRLDLVVGFLEVAVTGVEVGVSLHRRVQLPHLLFQVGLQSQTLFFVFQVRIPVCSSFLLSLRGQLHHLDLFLLQDPAYFVLLRGVQGALDLADGLGPDVFVRVHDGGSEEHGDKLGCEIG
ncbi:hypothetical protein VP1G_11084 [Cytospora mali]|uniref:Uncharacterized protein n=1 Tax=Cytospora mali TaxID=578113 RepID=A0A194V3X6_CYTMA|nr:hypothetical protein VP1G_11084 [Valsa mali var. pyri (nom. inval.)]